jgi:hypothetical protein
MARSFSEDGAAGAYGGGNGGGSTSLSGGSMTTTPPPGALSTTQTSLGGAVPTARGGAGVQSGLADPASFSAADWATMNGTNPNAPVMSDPMSLYTGNGGGFSFADGGDVPDDGSTDPMAAALQSVDATLQHGYQKYGLSNNPNGSSSNYSGFNQSPNVEDRRNDWGSDGGVGGAIRDYVQTPVSNFIGKAYSLYDRVAQPDIKPGDEDNPMGKDLGINSTNDPQNTTLQGLGPTGEDANDEPEGTS